MPKMTDPRELFLHELGDLLYAENVLVKALPKLADEASDDKLRAGFEAHLEETKQHVKNVEKAFAKLGEKPSAEKCPGRSFNPATGVAQSASAVSSHVFGITGRNGSFLGCE